MDEQFFSPSRTIFHDLHMNRFKDIYREAFIIIWAVAIIRSLATFNFKLQILNITTFTVYLPDRFNVKAVQLFVDRVWNWGKAESHNYKIDKIARAASTGLNIW